MDRQQDGKMVRTVTGKRERVEGGNGRKCEKRKGLEMRGKGQESPARSLEGEVKQAAKTATKPTLPALRHTVSHCSQHTMSQ